MKMMIGKERIPMTEQQIKSIVTAQRKYFQTGATLPVEARISALKRLYVVISECEKEIHSALKRTWEKAGLKAICVKQDWFWKKSAIC